MSENMSDAKNVSSNKAKEMKAHLEQENSKDHEKTPASDLYSKVKDKDPETGVEKPTEEAVEEAMEWNQENQM